MEFYEAWRANPKWWFKATPEDDAYICDNFKNQLNCTPRIDIATVVIFDQLPCHVYRNQPNARDLIAQLRETAVGIASEYIARHGVSHLDDIDFTFLLLPFRHTGDLKQCMWVASLAWERSPTSPLIRSFIKATYERAPRDQSGWVDQHLPPTAPQVWQRSDFEDVLEYAPLNLRWKDVSLKEIGDAANALKYHPWPDAPIIISLSGGVDSMVIATILRRLFPQRALIAVHINYCNRAESYHEEAFVRHWAAILGMPYYVRNITELQRAQTKDFMRSTYESYTRDVRYSTYSHVCQHAHVVLGHHEDDAFENVLTNIAHCEKFECLRGMQPSSNCKGPIGPIDFHRPLLRVSKKDIYKAAWALGIPYVQDSTLRTTQRGTIRDVLRPTLEQWDPCIVRRLLDMADIVGEFANSFEKDVNDAVANTRRGKDGLLRWTTLNQVHSPILSPRFWRRYFQNVIRVTPSWKSLENMRWLIDRMVKKSVGFRVMLTKHVEVSMSISNATTVMFVIQQRTRSQGAMGPFPDTWDTVPDEKR